MATPVTKLPSARNGAPLTPKQEKIVQQELVDEQNNTRLVNPASEIDADLLHILSTNRPHGSKYEKEILKWIESKAPDGAVINYMSDNLVITIAPKSDVATVPPKRSRTLFSCHVDTAGSHAGPVKLAYDPNLKQIILAKREPDPQEVEDGYQPSFGFGDFNYPTQKWGSGYTVDPRVLGADDGAGVWLMVKMMAEEIPGAYVFHVGEERGGVGSRALRKDHAIWLGGFDRAIAFDRPRCDEVITHQRGGRCCSDEFGKALAEKLSTGGLKYRISSDGVFTDTANYVDVIPECTNIGVGYSQQHSPSEWQSWPHLKDLLDAVLDVDWERLPVVRMPEEVKVTPRVAKVKPGFGTAYTNGLPAPTKGVGQAGKPKTVVDDDPAELSLDTDVSTLTYIELLDRVESDPEGAARLLIELTIQLEQERRRSEMMADFYASY